MHVPVAVDPSQSAMKSGHVAAVPEKKEFAPTKLLLAKPRILPSCKVLS